MMEILLSYNGFNGSGYGHIGQVISGVEDGLQDDVLFRMVQAAVKDYIDAWCFYSFNSQYNEYFRGFSRDSLLADVVFGSRKWHPQGL